MAASAGRTMNIGTGTVAVVTGAANGIGRAIALDLSRRGASLALIDIDRAGLDAVAASLPRCSTHLCDVTDLEQVRAASTETVAAHGAIHILINNAGISVAGAVERLTLEDIHLAMGVNFWGVVHSCRTFLPHLRASAERGESAAVCTVLSDF